jgi:hypothetical protein
MFMKSPDVGDRIDRLHRSYQTIKWMMVVTVALNLAGFAILISMLVGR